MNSLNKTLDAIAKPFLGITPWLLRLSLGVSFFLHGYGKLPLPPQNLVKWFESGGMPAPDVVASAVSIGEMSAGLGIILGGFFANNLGNLITRLSGGAVVVITFYPSDCVQEHTKGLFHFQNLGHFLQVHAETVLELRPVLCYLLYVEIPL